MPKVKALMVGKLKSRAVHSIVDDYAKRLGHYFSFEMLEVKDSAHLTIQHRKAEEGKRLLEKIKDQDLVVLLDERGELVTSKKLAEKTQNWFDQGCGQLVFIIGGAYGVSEDVFKRAQWIWSLSILTLPHELVRAFLLEQLYRSQTILRGEKYHHE